MLEIASVTWKQPKWHYGQGTEFICSPFKDIADWDEDEARWFIPLSPLKGKKITFVDFCPFCGADLQEEKPVLP